MNKVQFSVPWQHPFAIPGVAAGAACVYAVPEDVGMVGGTGFSLWDFSFPPDTSPFSLPGPREQQPRNKFSLAPIGPLVS